MSIQIVREKPFEFLTRKETGEKFEEDIVKNWYIARAFVIDKLRNEAFRPDSNEHLHVVVMGDDPRMLSVVRQVALSAHYINFHEGNNEELPCNRTVITIVSTLPNIKEELQREEYLCNLPKFCKYIDKNSEVENTQSFVDIEIHVVEECPPKNENKHEYFFSKEDVDTFFDQKQYDNDILCIDTRKAEYASRMYDLGAIIDNLPAEDIHCAKRYNMALDVFQNESLKRIPKPMFKESSCTDLCKVKEMLSNIFCADCFESRRKSIQLCSGTDEKRLWETNNEALSRSEHARWIVEKLIMGYSPLNDEQRYKDECLFYDKIKKTQYRHSLKKNSKNPAHIDLCSYADLRRINPDDLKFDSFLMLAIPKILDKVKE